MIFHPLKDFDKNVNKDIVLCSTANASAGQTCVDALIRDSIAFSQKWRSVSIRERTLYRGASKVCEISINRNQYAKARRSLESLSEACRDRIVLNVR